MACATLKRSHNFEILESTCSKRRRYQTLSPNCNTEVTASESPFIPKQLSTRISSQASNSWCFMSILAQLKRRIKEEIKRLQRRRLIPRFLGGPPPAISTTFTSHLQDNVAVASCSGSFRSMVLRSPTTDSQDSDSDQSPLRNSEPAFPTLGTTSVPSSQSPSQSVRNLDSVPIFTLPQVTALCERLMKEREDELREEYDDILSCKLAGENISLYRHDLSTFIPVLIVEQYEAFLKFNHDQLCSRFQNSPMSLCVYELAETVCIDNGCPDIHYFSI
ncbi:unnamed protein product [Trichobilharzia regenti]|nr:unnamed protein product [Trichobilharzia regenti]